MEERCFAWGKYNFSYYIFKEDRKTVSLRVTPKMKIIVKCPIEMKEKDLNEFLKRKYDWTAKQLEFFKKFQGKKEKQYISGEAVLYLGRQYKLVIRKGEPERAVLKGGELCLFIENGVDNAEYNETVLREWHQQRAKEIFTKRLAEMLKKFDFSFTPIIVIRKMEKKWGSFTGKRKIILNSKLIQASRDCIDYVIIHELCHFKYRDHSHKFYKLLSSKIPNWEKVRDKLEMRFL